MCIRNRHYTNITHKLENPLCSPQKTISSEQRKLAHWEVDRSYSCMIDDDLQTRSNDATSLRRSLRKNKAQRKTNLRTSLYEKTKIYCSRFKNKNGPVKKDGNYIL